MEPPLADKVAFFERLSALQDKDERDDQLDIKEQNHRSKCKAFFTSSTSTANPRTPGPAPIDSVRIENLVSNQQLSDPISTDVDDDLEIVKVTPRDMSTPRERRDRNGRKGKEPAANEHVIPDTVRPNDRSAVPAFLHPMLRPHLARLFSTQSSPSASASTTTASSSKRKAGKTQAKLKLLPENQQIFKGLRFYYIPNDDRGIRKAQIPKAQERGATWVGTLQEATHILVDEGLVYKDIESILQSDPSALTKVIVNGTYPIDCGEHRTLLDPNQEKYVRNIKVPRNDPKNSDAMDETIPSSLPSNGSLQVKGKRRRSSTDDHITSSDDSPGEEEPHIGNSKANTPQNTVKATSVHDELSEYIGLVQENTSYLQEPLEEEEKEGEDEGQSPAGSVVDIESESSNQKTPKKKRKTRTQDSSSQADVSSQSNFACMTGGTEGGKSDDPNARTIELLQKMADSYEGRDHFRALSYRKGISTLRQQDKKITTTKEAVKLRNIGQSLAEKIEEIVTNDRLEKLEHAQQQPEEQIMRMFLKIYGVGMAQANKWVAQGHRTLEDLKENVKLTTSQKIGIEHYDDLNERIPRWEVEALAKVVKETAAGIDASVEFIIGGSYRRGSDTTGDIDLIITKKGTETAQDLLPFLRELVAQLTDKNFLTASLASFSSNASEGHGSKWHGCCVLPESAFPEEKGKYRPIWRRIDLLLVPESEFGAALLYFTGNDIFNRSLRLLASKKGMRLNQRGLYANVRRGPGRVKQNEGDLLEGRDERKIFELLGVKWREPHERWC